MTDGQRMAIVGRAQEIVAKLTREERAALAKLAPATLMGSIAEEDEKKFTKLGLVERKLGGLAKTPIGQIAAELASRGK